ncbi:ubiquitin carboxyl-terminal hydrolase [Cystoisospora suis]|uniref:ubiquitinyl hydrolase 1 n=1 Tax=Cystoisospora suis TaxID=483139 RepID=A0A2C6KHD6_9APIC|nr:ubiquitin carboxyl-terminal hydrolase [Cystoisospora suis]
MASAFSPAATAASYDASSSSSRVHPPLESSALLDSSIGIESDNRGQLCVQRALRRHRGAAEQTERKTAINASDNSLSFDARILAREKNVRVKGGGLSGGADNRRRGPRQQQHRFETRAQEDGCEPPLNSPSVAAPSYGGAAPLPGRQLQQKVVPQTPQLLGGVENICTEARESVAASVWRHVPESVYSSQKGTDAARRGFRVSSALGTSFADGAAVSPGSHRDTSLSGLDGSAAPRVEERRDPGGPVSELSGENKEGQQEVPWKRGHEMIECSTQQSSTSISSFPGIPELRVNPMPSSWPSPEVGISSADTAAEIREVSSTSKEENTETDRVSASPYGTAKHLGVPPVIQSSNCALAELREWGAADSRGAAFKDEMVRGQETGRVPGAAASSTVVISEATPAEGEASGVRVRASQGPYGGGGVLSPPLSAVTPPGVSSVSRHYDQNPVPVEGSLTFSVAQIVPYGVTSSSQISSFPQHEGRLSTGTGVAPLAGEALACAPRTWAQRVAESERAGKEDIRATDRRRTLEQKGDALRETPQVVGNASGEQASSALKFQRPLLHSSVSPVTLPRMVLVDTAREMVATAGTACAASTTSPARHGLGSDGSFIPFSVLGSSVPPVCPASVRASAASPLLSPIASLPPSPVSRSPSYSGSAGCVMPPLPSCWSRGPSAAVKQAPSGSPWKGLSSGKTSESVRSEDASSSRSGRGTRIPGRDETTGGARAVQCEGVQSATADGMPVTDRDLHERADRGTIPVRRENEPVFVRQQALEEKGREAGRGVGEAKLSREDDRLRCEAGPEREAGEETKEQRRGEEETKGAQKLFYLLNAVLDRAASMERARSCTTKTTAVDTTKQGAIRLPLLNLQVTASAAFSFCPPGLLNTHNNCYLNAVFQALLPIWLSLCPVFVHPPCCSLQGGEGATCSTEGRAWDAWSGGGFTEARTSLGDLFLDADTSLSHLNSRFPFWSALGKACRLILGDRRVIPGQPDGTAPVVDVGGIFRSLLYKDHHGKEMARVAEVGWGRQADASEFLLLLLSGLHEECKWQSRRGRAASELNAEGGATTLGEDDGFVDIGKNRKKVIQRVIGTEEDSLIYRLFGGRLRAVCVDPRTGSKLSDNTEFFLLLSCSVLPHLRSLEAVLDHHFADRDVEPSSVGSHSRRGSDDASRQKRGGAPKSTGKRPKQRVISRIDSAPPVLVILLQRFSFDRQRQQATKVSHLVDLSETLTLRSNWLVQKTAMDSGAGDPGDQLNRENCEDGSSSLSDKQKTYSLTGVVCHKGFELDSGHYTAATRVISAALSNRASQHVGTVTSNQLNQRFNGAHSEKGDSWVVCDDSHCIRRPFSHVRAMEGHYLLFFVNRGWQVNTDPSVPFLQARKWVGERM